MMPLSVRAYGDTNKGLFRELNEDNLLVGRTVFAVADGMGGHVAGEVASATAANSLRELDGSTFETDTTATDALVAAIRLANERVLAKAAEDHTLGGMGTTLTAVMIRDQSLHLAHVGDSRAYLLRDGVLQQLTDDHTFVNQLIKTGQLTEEEAAVHPQRSVITRAIGVERVIDVDTMVQPLQLLGGDQVLLCSDGLTGPVSDSLIGDILRDEADGQIACQRLIDAANAGGGPDNITCVLLRMSSDAEGATEENPASSGSFEPFTHDDMVTAELMNPVTVPSAPPSVSGTQPIPVSSGKSHEDGPHESSNPHPKVEPQVSLISRLWFKATLALVSLAIVLLGAGFFINSQVYIGLTESNEVTVFRGIPSRFVNVPLSRIEEPQGFYLNDLPVRLHTVVESGILFSSREAADVYIEETLRPALQEVQQTPDATTPTLGPTDMPTVAPVPTLLDTEVPVNVFPSEAGTPTLAPGREPLAQPSPVGTGIDQ